MATESKSQHLSLRVDPQTFDYLDGLAEDWGIDNRSEVLRLIIKSHNGLLFGNFFGIVDNEKLAAEWGDVGHLLAAANEADRGVPSNLQEPRLVDIVESIPMLVAAAEVEAGNVDTGAFDPEGGDAAD